MGIIFTSNLDKLMMDNDTKIEKATFGAGCFWCVEAIFDRVEGVVDVQAGYTGGSTENPTYEEICTGTTGHAEVIQIDYNPCVIRYVKLLDVFWKSHDPTTLNRQGADIGTQYRSAIYFHNKEQQLIAEKSIQSTNKLGIYNNPIVTELSPLEQFFPAENYHQDYFRLNPDVPYCKIVIQPKLKKLFK